MHCCASATTSPHLFAQYFHLVFGESISTAQPLDLLLNFSMSGHCESDNGYDLLSCIDSFSKLFYCLRASRSALKVRILKVVCLTCSSPPRPLLSFNFVLAINSAFNKLITAVVVKLGVLSLQCLSCTVLLSSQILGNCSRSSVGFACFSLFRFPSRSLISLVDERGLSARPVLFQRGSH